MPSISCHFLYNNKSTKILPDISSEFEQYMKIKRYFLKTNVYSARGIWKYFKNITKKELENKSEFFLFSFEHSFLDFNFSPDFVFHCLKDTQKKRADVLLGGVESFDHPIQITANFFWIKNFSGFKFLIIFRHLYSKILKVRPSSKENIESCISKTAQAKFIIYSAVNSVRNFKNLYPNDTDNANSQKPMITSGLYQQLFMLDQTGNHLLAARKRKSSVFSLMDIIFPLYLINLKERPERLIHSLKQFKNKPEFEVNIIEARKHEIGAVGLWQSIVSCIKEGYEQKVTLRPSAYSLRG